MYLQYMSYIDAVKLLIERRIDWSLHLVAVDQILTLIAATGQNSYARTARL